MWPAKQTSGPAHDAMDNLMHERVFDLLPREHPGEVQIEGPETVERLSRLAEGTIVAHWTRSFGPDMT